MICFPLDNTEYEANALGAWCSTRTRGVFAADGHYTVTATGGMTVTVSPGLAWLKAGDYWGVNAFEANPQRLTVATADGALSRIDAVCIRLDKNRNLGEIVIKKGAYSPQPPTIAAPVRNSDYDEIYVATIMVRAGATAIGPDDITDQRLNETYCGIMRDGVSSIPTQQLYNEWKAWFTSFSTVSESEFDAWFENLQDQLDDNQATNLQNQITKLGDDVYTLAIPTVGGGTLVYDGNEQSPAWDGYYPNAMTIGGDVSKTATGSYATTFTPKGNYHWADGTQATKSVTWEISVKIVPVPRAANRLTESAALKAPTWIGYDPKIMSMSQDLHVNVGNYSTVFTLTDNSCAWPPNYASGRQITVPWRIYPKELHQDGDGCYYQQWVSGSGDTITEWLNPPMQVGVEYRTTERYLGQPVYTKLLDLGQAVNGKQVAWSGINVIRHAGTLRYHTMPYGAKGDMYWAISDIWDGGIILQCSDAFAASTFNWQEQIWYIKTLPVG